MMAFILRCASFIEIFTSALDVNVIETEDKLSKDLESIFFDVFQGRNRIFNLLVTVFSTSLGDARDKPLQSKSRWFQILGSTHSLMAVAEQSA
jgi:hypothetical protein